MSSTGIEEVTAKLLAMEWEEQEKTIIVRIINNLKMYSYLMSASMKNDVISIIRLCIQYKQHLQLHCNEGDTDCYFMGEAKNC